MYAVVNLCGKMVIAYRIGSDMTASLVTDTIREAKQKEKVTDGLALHSDQGSQYTFQVYHDLLTEYHIKPSMSSPTPSKERLLDEIDVTKELIAKLIKGNATEAQNQEECLSKYENLAQRHDKLKSRYEILCAQRECRLYPADTPSAFMSAIHELDILNLKWTPTLCHTTVDNITVNADRSVVFHFKNGSEMEI